MRREEKRGKKREGEKLSERKFSAYVFVLSPQRERERETSRQTDRHRQRHICD
jgi:hypothetical protein